MGTESGTVRPLRWWLAPFAVLVAVLAGLATAAPASAHAELISADPADGATVTSLPTTATLTFSEEIDPSTAQVALTDAAGATLSSVPPFTAAGTTVSQPLPATLPAGAYTLAYRIVSLDGHPVGGTVRFTVAGSATSASPSVVSSQPASDATPTSASTPPTSPAAAGATSVAGSPVAASSDDGGSGALWWVLAVVVVLVVVAGVVVLRRRGATRAG